MSVEKTSGECPKFLFIEADEDHVIYQDGTSHYEKMVYIYEGYRQVDKSKRALISPHCITQEVAVRKIFGIM
ncbi:UPF0236 family transposase-like protein [Ligilactobacillus equi]|uniref:UPF0236 family transposase-like protein n=1 Tax=Ligilactobacillus equi TaxID=137357 RepID=UPI0034E2C51B